MSKTWLVARREFVENARTKGFWISIILGPLLILGSIGLMVFLQTKKDVRNFTVLDRTGWLAEAIEADFKAPDLGRILETFAGEESPETAKQGGNEALPRPAFLDAPTWEQIAKAYKEAKPKQRDQLESVGAMLLRPELAKIGRDFPMDQIPGMAKGMLKGLNVKEGDIKRAWSDLWSFREWWQGLSGEDRKGLTRRGWDPRFAYLPLQEDKPVSEKELDKRIKKGDLYAYFVLDDVQLSEPRIGRYVSKNVTDKALPRWYAGRATEVLRRKRIEKLGIGEGAAQQILMRASFTDRTFDASGKQKTVGVSDIAEKGAPVAFVIILFMSILMISQMLLTNTIEEKSNRIIEVLLSSVSPLQLMTGKIVGLALTGIAILGFYAVFAFAVISLAPTVLPQSAEILLKLNLQAILANPRYIGSFFLYFLTGYVFFASLLVAIGSVSNSLKDAQNLAQPVMVLLMVPYIASFMIVSDPNGTVARVLSYIPPFTPFIMMGRAGGPPPMIDYVITTVMLIITTVACFYAAAKVFRVGILMTGKPPKVREILRWLRAPVGQVPQARE